MLTEQQILSKLDHFRFGPYCQFINLGNTYCYLIDSRLNIFKGEQDEWAIVAERLGYNPRADSIILEICYFGNCLQNLDHYNGSDINYYIVEPIEREHFYKTIDGENLKPNAESWIVRGQNVQLSHDKNDYKASGIDLSEYIPNAIRIDEAARLTILTHNSLFRATDEELYRSIPNSLKKILVIDEWYHRDFEEIIQPPLTDETLMKAFDLNPLLKEQTGMNENALKAMFREQEARNEEWNRQQVQNNSPSSYETWQLLAKVICTGDVSAYRPTIAANSHWRNWPESGSM